MLMSAILANPDEDTPRLAFADWLDEHGDAHDRTRASFIRLQIDHAKHHGTALQPEPDPAQKAEWLKPLDRLGPPAPVKVASAFGLLPHQSVRRYKVTRFDETLPVADRTANPQALTPLPTLTLRARRRNIE